MELGGNISLEGFDSIEPGMLVVVKKIVGNYAKKISEIKEFKKFIVKYSNPGIEITVQLDDKELTEKMSHNNLFFALSEALNKLLKSLG